MSILAKRYARALFALASEKGAVDAVTADLAKVAGAFDDPAARAVLMDPQTKRSERKSVLLRLLGDGHELSSNLIGVLSQRRREDIVPAMHEAFIGLAREARGELEGVVETAVPLDDGQTATVSEAVAKLVGQKVDVRTEVNADLIGGVRVRVGNTLYDGSVATALEELERRLMDAPL